MEETSPRKIVLTYSEEQQCFDFADQNEIIGRSWDIIDPQIDEMVANSFTEVCLLEERKSRINGIEPKVSLDEIKRLYTYFIAGYFGVYDEQFINRSHINIENNE